MVLHNRKCNRCGFKGKTIYFVKGIGYKFGCKPLCLDCHSLDNRKRRESKSRKPYTPRIKQELEINITDEGINILINNGFARNREEALQYIQ